MHSWKQRDAFVDCREPAETGVKWSRQTARPPLSLLLSPHPPLHSLISSIQPSNQQPTDARFHTKYDVCARVFISHPSIHVVEHSAHSLHSHPAHEICMTRSSQSLASPRIAFFPSLSTPHASCPWGRPSSPKHTTHQHEQRKENTQTWTHTIHTTQRGGWPPATRDRDGWREDERGRAGKKEWKRDHMPERGRERPPTTA